VGGDEMQSVPPPAAGNTSIVTWKVKVLQTGTFPLKVVSNNGASQSKTISIARQEAEAEARLKMDLAGSFEPGQEFAVTANLFWPGAGAAPSPQLTLPAGLVETAGPAYKNTPDPDRKGTLIEATWKVKVQEPGTFPVRVGWHGMAVTKTLSIVRPEAPRAAAMSTWPWCRRSRPARRSPSPRRSPTRCLTRR